MVVGVQGENRDSLALVNNGQTLRLLTVDLLIFLSKQRRHMQHSSHSLSSLTKDNLKSPALN